MSRELNRDLFGDPESTGPRPMTKKETVPATVEDLKVISFQIDSMTRKLKEFESKVEVLASKWEEFSLGAKLRFERIQGNFQRQSEAVQSGFRDVHAKIAAVASRINERKMSDTTVADKIEWQSEMAQMFEARLQQLQKTVSEQEMRLRTLSLELKDLKNSSLQTRL